METVVDITPYSQCLGCEANIDQIVQMSNDE